MVIRDRIRVSPEFRQLFLPLLLFLLYIGLSLIVVSVSSPNLFATSLASYLRLVLTASIAPVFHLTLTERWDMQFFHKALILFAMITVAVGAYLFWTGLEHVEGEVLAHIHQPTMHARSGGIIGVGFLGLISGLLILYAFIKRDENYHLLGWTIPLMIGSLGLFLAKTGVSIFAAAGAVTIYFATMRPRRGRAPALLRRVAVGAIMTAVATLAVSTLRPDDVSGLTNTSGGSYAERLMLAYAGLRIFLDNPLIGVGWQASAAEAVMGSSALTADLMEKFTELPAHFFLGQPSVHNMYIQFLAELGIIGVVLFAWVCFRTGKSVARLVKEVPAESQYKHWMKFYALALIFLLIWWNGNPLYGGQTETILAFTFLGVLANVTQLEKQRVERSHAINRRP